NSYSARIESFTIADDFGTGSLQPGESGGIILNVKNYLNPVRRLEAIVTPFQGGQWITIHDSIVPFGQGSRMQVLENIQAALRVTLADSVPRNTTIVMKVRFRDTLVGYVPVFAYFSFVVYPLSINLDTAYMRTS